MDDLAAEYHTLTEIPPAECMVVMTGDVLAMHVAFERKPEAWK